MDVKSSLRAFTIWTLLSYGFGITAAVISQSLLEHGFASRTATAWPIHLTMLVPSLLAASIGVVVLWLLPIRRPAIGLVAGVAIAAVTILTLAMIATGLWGGFEGNIGIFLATATLMFPNVAAGGYAGWLRSKEPPKPKPSGWWPTGTA
jgi:hypothetical protein